MTQAAQVTLSHDAPTTPAQILDATPQASPPTTESASGADERISPKLQALVRREKIAVERERAAKEKEAAIEAKAHSFSEREARLTEFETLKKVNPMKALELLGLSYKDLTEIAMADGNVTPDIQVRRVEEKFNSFIEAQKETEKKAIEDAKARAELQEQETISKFQGEITNYLKENSARYELIAFEGAEDLVYGVVDEHYERTKDAETGLGEVLTIAQAADKVEAHLEQKYDKARNLTKVKTLLAPRQEKPTVAKPQQPTRQPQKTLTNSLSATPTRTKAVPITDEERIAKAIAYAKSLHRS